MEKKNSNGIMVKFGRAVPLMVFSAVLLSACGTAATSTSPTATVGSTGAGAATAATGTGAGMATAGTNMGETGATAVTGAGTAVTGAATAGTGVLEGVATNVAGTINGSLLTLQLGEQNASGQNGKATLTDMGNGKIKVVLDLSNGTAEPQPAHIHKGSCATLDPKPLIPLSNVVNGKSETEIDATMATLTSGHAINIHKSAAEATVYVACADIQGVPGMMEGTPGAMSTPGAMMESTPMMQGTATP